MSAFPARYPFVQHSYGSAREISVSRCRAANPGIDVQLSGTTSLSKPGRTFPGCLHRGQILIPTLSPKHLLLTSINQTAQRREQPNRGSFLVTDKTLEAAFSRQLSALGRDGRLALRKGSHDESKGRHSYMKQDNIHTRVGKWTWIE